VPEQLTGFWRRIRLTPSQGAVQAEVEDDFHCMSVIVHHSGGNAIRIEPDMRRAPWSTCPGAEHKLMQTFTGLPLKQFAERGDKKANCTHLYDMAMLAAAHAQDGAQTIYDIQVSDAIDNERVAEIRKNGETLLKWTESGFHLVKPDAAAGIRLDKLRSWIDTLEPGLQEPARLLQWGNMLANGRSIPIEQQSDATKMPPNCYSFQPEMAIKAKRIGEILDFSQTTNQRTEQPLDKYKPVVEQR